MWKKRLRRRNLIGNNSIAAAREIAMAGNPEFNEGSLSRPQAGRTTLSPDHKDLTPIHLQRVLYSLASRSITKELFSVQASSIGMGVVLGSVARLGSSEVTAS